METVIKIENGPPTGDVREEKVDEIKILWFDITNLGKNVRFCICCAVVFLFYLIYGFLQELIFTLDGFKPYGWYLTLVQFLYYSLFGFIEQNLRKLPKRKIPLHIYLLLALLTLGTMGFSNSSLGYLNYPTQVIFKCCKLIPVLIGGIVIQKKKYGILDFIAAGCMCAGLALFTLADSQMSPNFSAVGVLMISSALVCDAAIGNVQEKYMKSYRASNTEIVLYSYFIGFLYLFATMLLTGDLQKGITFCSKHPKETYGLALLFSLSGYLGIQVVLTLVRTCGAFAAATVTTCRKAVTIILSFLFFTKPFTFQYVWSGLLVVFGIYLNIFSKSRTESTNLSILLANLRRMVYSWISPTTKYSSGKEEKILTDV